MVGGASVAAAFARGLLSKSVFAADAADVYEYMGPPHLPPSPAPSSLPEGRGRYSGGSMVPWGISERGRDEGRGASASCVFPATNGEEEKETLSHSNSSCLQGRNEEKEIGQFERLGKKKESCGESYFFFLCVGMRWLLPQGWETPMHSVCIVLLLSIRLPSQPNPGVDLKSPLIFL